MLYYSEASIPPQTSITKDKFFLTIKFYDHETCPWENIKLNVYLIKLYIINVICKWIQFIWDKLYLTRKVHLYVSFYKLQKNTIFGDVKKIKDE